MKKQDYYIQLRGRQLKISSDILDFAKVFAREHKIFHVIYMYPTYCIIYNNRADRDKVYKAIVQKFGVIK